MSPHTDSLIDALVESLHGHDSQRERRALRESLRSLVRLAQAELRCEMRASVMHLIGDWSLDSLPAVCPLGQSGRTGQRSLWNTGQRSS